MSKSVHKPEEKKSGEKSVELPVINSGGNNNITQSKSTPPAYICDAPKPKAAPVKQPLAQPTEDSQIHSSTKAGQSSLTVDSGQQLTPRPPLVPKNTVTDEKSSDDAPDKVSQLLTKIAMKYEKSWRLTAKNSDEFAADTELAIQTLSRLQSTIVANSAKFTPIFV